MKYIYNGTCDNWLLKSKLMLRRGCHDDALQRNDTGILLLRLKSKFFPNKWRGSKWSFPALVASSPQSLALKTPLANLYCRMETESGITAQFFFKSILLTFPRMIRYSVNAHMRPSLRQFWLAIWPSPAPTVHPVSSPHFQLVNNVHRFTFSRSLNNFLQT